MSETADYNKTLILPETDFPMRANLPQREPQMLEAWEKDRKYYKLQERDRKLGKKRYVLHDGPPYANGDIHIGTALNKILKDIIVKYKTMTGYNAPYVPGWDCHGLPIEKAALKKLGIEKKGPVDTAVLRKNCREFALSCLAGQKAQFKRLGIWGDFDNPYLTIAPDFEAKQVEVFGEIYKKGYIYKGLKPVYWCADCATALAEAEVEYQDDDCNSIYVKFPITKPSAALFQAQSGIDLQKAFVVIWTTTTWTLPGNVAICLGPDFTYTFIKTQNGEYLLVAKDLAETVAAECCIENYELVGSFSGKELEFTETSHPFLPRNSTVIVGGHVTLESGTGCVHTAPGFGLEDYEVCGSYRGRFEIVVPVDARGRLTLEAGENVMGKPTGEANEIIAEDLKARGLLLGLKKLNHSYPHCWRCHKPIIYRATDQWFCSVGDFVRQTIAEIEQTQWIPEWGEERIKNMVIGRSDWCISRQRRWGVPIPVLYCKECGESVCNDDTIKATSDLFRQESSDSWYIRDAGEFIPESVVCPKCGSHSFDKEQDIFDVWFDSGCTHAAVLKQREELAWPADLYLEGGDQYRGWFQSSLLTAVATDGKAPYKAVCTHGWVVDGKGEQIHKSKGNAVPPEFVIDKYGADVLRLWVASLDFHADLRISNEILVQIAETYRKIRNTARFMLSNLCNGKTPFDPNKNRLPLDQLSGIDRYALSRYDELVAKVRAAYEEMDYYHAYHAINQFCVTDMSSFYLDIIKDRLYCDEETSAARRSSQTAMYEILSGFTRLIAPILVFTSDEIWSSLPHLDSDDENGVVFNDMPEPTGVTLSDDDFWRTVAAIRPDVLSALEQKRADKTIGKSLEAKVILYPDRNGNAPILPEGSEKELAAAFIVSQVELAYGLGEYSGVTPGLSITVKPADGQKCARCWSYSTEVGTTSGHADLCCRCASVVK